MRIGKIAQELDFDVEDVAMLLEVFMQSARENIEKLIIAAKADDYESIHKAAHSIKGSAANLLLEDIANSALHVERSAKNKESIDYLAYAKQLENALGEIEKEM